MKAELTHTATGTFRINCPGCREDHFIPTLKPNSSGAIWSFSGDLNAPTFSPSLHIKTGLYAGSKLADENDPKYPNAKQWNQDINRLSRICHSFIRDGKIEFLNDCTHHLKGQTVDLPEL